MVTYNHENFISQAIEGVLMQKTKFPIELIIGEDCSTDNTRKICLEYKEKYPDRIKLLLPEKNLGAQQNFLETVNVCQGKYIALCEGDDYWTDSYKLQKQVDFLEANEDYGFVYTDVDFFYQATKSFQKGVFKNNIIQRTHNFEEHLIRRGYLAPCTWIFRKELLAVVDWSLISTDGTFAIMLDWFKNTKVYFYDEVTAVYRVSEGTASRPTDLKKRYNYEKGVFETQKIYIERYNVTKCISNYICTDAYFRLLRFAIEIQDTDFITEAETFFAKNSLDFKVFLDSCTKLSILYEDINKLHKELDKVRVSKAYRLGKFLLKPFSIIKNARK